MGTKKKYSCGDLSFPVQAEKSCDMLLKYLCKDYMINLRNKNQVKQRRIESMTICVVFLS
jgi:hypothetical protein